MYEVKTFLKKKDFLYRKCDQINVFTSQILLRVFVAAADVGTGREKKKNLII